MVHCMTELQQVTAHPPDWSLSIACHAKKRKCLPLCQELSAFLHDPQSESYVCQIQTDLLGWRHLQR